MSSAVATAAPAPAHAPSTPPRPNQFSERVAPGAPRRVRVRALHLDAGFQQEVDDLDAAIAAMDVDMTEDAEYPITPPGAQPHPVSPQSPTSPSYSPEPQ